jgi:hypothetical protein
MMEDKRKITTTNEWTTACRPLFRIKLFVFLLLPLAFSRPHAWPCCALVRSGLRPSYLAGVLLFSFSIACVSMVKNVSARWDKQRAFLAGDRSTPLRCNLKCFFIPSRILTSNMRCGESRVWPICQRYYSIKVYDRRSCMSIFPRSLFPPRIPLHLCQVCMTDLFTPLLSAGPRFLLALRRCRSR